MIVEQGYHSVITCEAEEKITLKSRETKSYSWFSEARHILFFDLIKHNSDRSRQAPVSKKWSLSVSGFIWHPKSTVMTDELENSLSCLNEFPWSHFILELDYFQLSTLTLTIGIRITIYELWLANCLHCLLLTISLPSQPCVHYIATTSKMLFITFIGRFLSINV